MDMPIPKTLTDTHRDVKRGLARAVEAGGRTGQAAKEAAKLLRPHMEREERLVLPLLALLEPLARRTLQPDAREVLPLLEALKDELPEMLREHGFILPALETLAAAGRSERHGEVIKLCHDLEIHARAEEEILYPAAVLAGEYVRLTQPT